MNREKALDILGLHSDADDEEIKLAYRKCAQRWHPDKAKGSESMFKSVKEAYDFLTGKPPVDNARALMLERVSGLFMAAVEACDNPERYDLLERVIASLQHVIRELEQQIIMTRRAVVKREKILKRLRGRREEDTFLQGLIAKDILRHQKSIAELEAEKPKAQEVIDFLKNYEYQTADELHVAPYSRGIQGLLGDYS